jgi:mxaJ protein
MSSRCLSLAAVLLAACAAANARELRVCADPNNLPFSNSRSEGFENKVAELVARELGAKLQYTWWAQRRAFVRNSLGNGACDVIMGLPPDYPSVLTTEPWYRSTYVLLSRDLPVKSLYDPALRTARIGVHVVGEDYAPPAQELARRGITITSWATACSAPTARPTRPPNWLMRWRTAM